MDATAVRELLPYLTPAERAEVEHLLAADKVIWRPLPGPQSMAYYSTADIIGYGGSAGGGKGLTLDTPIATPTGWKTIGELRENDEVFDDQGQPCKVLAVTSPTFRPCFKLTFDDGSTLVADDVHRWVTFDAQELSCLTRYDPAWRAARRAKRPSKVAGNKSEAFTAALRARNIARAHVVAEKPRGTMRDTLELCATLRTPTGRANHAIPMAAPLRLLDATLPIPPYTLGAWLGDGTSRNAQLTGIDADIWSRIEADGFKVRHYDHKQHNILGLLPILRANGLLQNKHIPAAYLRASEAQRLALLQGLMDTDGHAALDGGCEFDNTNERIIDGVLELALSLGLKATKLAGIATLNGQIIGPKWRVRFTTSLQVFGMARKAQRLNTEPRRTNQFRYLVACEPVNSVPTRCIAVDSPSRQYLAGAAMIPTHNTDLAIGKALTQHEKVAIFRRVGTELTAIEDRMSELIGGTDGYNSQKKIWRNPVPGVQVEFGSVPNLGDEKNYQGRPKDLLVLDEAANFLLAQVQFLMGWVRTTNKAQRCQVLMTFNPPTSAEGRWIVAFFAPWLDPKHPKPAKPGELRYFAAIDGRSVERDDGTPFTHSGELITPQSRTFIPSRVSDNPYLMGTNYMTTLQALPEPLRSQMLYGDFQAGMSDDAMQTIPTEWVDIAMARWKPLMPKPEMDSMGVDVARGGADNTIIARRHGMWFDEALTYPGKATPDGPTVAGLVIAATRDNAPQHIDVIGVGASPYDFLNSAKQQVYGINVAEKARGMDKSGKLQFYNLRTELWWRMREALDPTANNGIALPPDPQLRADLCAPTWNLQGVSIKLESRDDIVKRIGRSPDWASAYVLALMDTPKRDNYRGVHDSRAREYDPFQYMSSNQATRPEHDPFN